MWASNRARTVLAVSAGCSPIPSQVFIYSRLALLSSSPVCGTRRHRGSFGFRSHKCTSSHSRTVEWVAELKTIAPLRRNATEVEAAMAMAAAVRRPAVAAEIANGVSLDMLLRSHAQGPNKQDQRGKRCSCAA